MFDKEENFDLTNSLELEVGDDIEYVGWYVEHAGDNIYKKIKYKHNLTGEILSAIETYFVTEEVWNGLVAYFNQE